MCTSIGVDVGGSHVTAVLLRGGKTERKKTVRFAPRSKSRDIVGLIKDAVYSVCEDPNKMPAIGVGVPGIVSDNGLVRLAPNLNLHRFDLRRALGETGLSAHILNDATAAALGEWHSGGWGPLQSLVCVTIGTGIGSGIVLDGRPFRGSFGRAGEIGHMVMDPDGPVCGCGQKGCLETLASATAIARQARVATPCDSVLSDTLAQKRLPLKRLSTKMVFRAMRDGSPMASKIVEQAAGWLGKALVNVVLLLDPDIIVLGGGVGSAGPDFTQLVRDEMALHMVCSLSPVRVVASNMPNDAGAIGAAVFALQSRP